MTNYDIIHSIMCGVAFAFGQPYLFGVKFKFLTSGAELISSYFFLNWYLQKLYQDEVAVFLWETLIKIYTQRIF